MTDDDLSELAECLADACRGKLLRPFNARTITGSVCSNCPLGALVDQHYPNPGNEAIVRLIPSAVAYGIARGFDGAGPISTAGDVDPRAYALGQLFRAWSAEP